MEIAYAPHSGSIGGIMRVKFFAQKQAGVEQKRKAIDNCRINNPVSAEL